MSDYWAIDIPGLSRDQAGEIEDFVRSRLDDRYAILVNPQKFLTFHFDDGTVRIVRSALELLRSSGAPGAVGAISLIEAIDYWIDSVAKLDDHSD